MRKYYRYKDSHRTIRGVKQKRCTMCEKWKPESDFCKDRARKDGLKIRCKSCDAEYGRERRKKNRGGAVREYLRYEDCHRVFRGVKQKLCRRCRKWKEYGQFRESRIGRDGLGLYCRECCGRRSYLRYEDSHRIIKGVRQKLCTKCRRWKDETAFYEARSARDGLSRWCKKCLCKAAAERYKQRLAAKM